MILVIADLLALRRLHDLDHQHLDMEHLLLQVGATLEPLPCLSRPEAFNLDRTNRDVKAALGQNRLIRRRQ